MQTILDGIAAAFRLLLSGDAELWGSTGRTLAISGLATVLAALAGIPVGVAIGLSRARSRRMLVASLYAGMGLPTVLVGLVLTVLLWREGPLGSLGLLYTPAAMVMGQVVIAFPVVAGLTVSAVDAIGPRVRRQVEALGATRMQTVTLIAIEARRGIIVAALAGFGHALSEVGAAMMLGGNLAGSTRVLTTATVLAARMGQLDLAIGLALLLFVIALVVNGSAVSLSTSRAA